jgi:hypothetical protein
VSIRIYRHTLAAAADSTRLIIANDDDFGLFCLGYLFHPVRCKGMMHQAHRQFRGQLIQFITREKYQIEPSCAKAFETITSVSAIGAMTSTRSQALQKGNQQSRSNHLLRWSRPAHGRWDRHQSHHPFPMRIESDPCTRGSLGNPLVDFDFLVIFGGLGAHRHDNQTLVRALYKENRPLVTVMALDFFFPSFSSLQCFPHFFPLRTL